MPAPTEYMFHRRGMTRGAVTGRMHRYEEGDVIEAPKGEFRHVQTFMYTARVVDTSRPDMKPNPSSAETVQADVVEDVAAGDGQMQYKGYVISADGPWTKVLAADGEKVGKSIRGSDEDAVREAMQRIDDLTD